MKWALAALAAAVFTCGCSHGIENKEAVHQGVIDYLNRISSQTGLDMNRMDVNVSSVTFKRDEANADVMIKPKGSAGAGMSTTYVLARNGDKWVVKGRKENGLNPHGAQGMPSAMPDSSGALPPGHPPTDPKPSDKQ